MARQWAARFVKLALLAAITWALYRSIGLDLADLNRDDLARWRPAPIPLAASAALLIAVYLSHAFLWRRILGDLIGARPGIGTAFRIYFLANLGRYLPGRVWQVAGMAVLARRAGVPVVGALAASALAQLSFLLTGALFLVLLMPFALGPGPTLGLLAGGAALIGGIGWSLATSGGERFRERIVARIGTRLGEKITAALGAVGRIRARDGMAWLAGYALSWVLLGAAFAIFTMAFVPETATEPRFLAGTMVAGYLSGYLAIFAPAGVGVREGVMGVMLARIAPAPAAFLVSIASRIWFTITELLVLLALPLLRRTADTTGNNVVPQEMKIDGPARTGSGHHPDL